MRSETDVGGLFYLKLMPDEYLFKENYLRENKF